MDPKTQHMQQARDTASLVSRLGITGANYAGAARRSDDGALDAARTDFASAVAEVHKALAERDALAARVGVLRELLTEAARVIRAINVEEYGAVPDALPITSRMDAAMAEPSAAPVEAASEAPAEPVSLPRFESAVSHGEPWMEEDERGDWVRWSDAMAAIAAARSEGYAAGMDRAAEVCAGVAAELWRQRARTPKDALTVGRMEGADQCVAAIRAAKGE